jgi:hypothetical protein
LVGVGYNGLVKHKSGINLLPQAQFWIGLPLHAIVSLQSFFNEMMIIQMY